MNDELAKHRDLVDLLLRKTGWSKIRVNEIMAVADICISLEAHDYPLPNWLSPDSFKTLKNLNGFIWNLHFSNPKNLQLRAGRFLEHLFSRLHDMSTGNSPLRMEAYSGHDTNVAAVLGALGIPQPEAPISFTGSLQFELLQNKNVRLIFRHGSLNTTPIVTQFPACPDQEAINGCPLKTIVAHARDQNMLLSSRAEYLRECGLDENRNANWRYMIAISLLSIALALIMGANIAFCVSGRRRRTNDGYQVMVQEPPSN